MHITKKSLSTFLTHFLSFTLSLSPSLSRTPRNFSPLLLFCFNIILSDYSLFCACFNPHPVFEEYQWHDNPLLRTRKIACKLNKHCTFYQANKSEKKTQSYTSNIWLQYLSRWILWSWRLILSTQKNRNSIIFEIKSTNMADFDWVQKNEK